MQLFGLPLNWPFTRCTKLHDKGILGMNKRNHAYISQYNPRRLFPLVDNKLKTKILAHQSQIIVPELIGVIRQQYDIKNILTLISGQHCFVIKPAKGSGGKGILVISHQDNGRFYKANGTEETIENIMRHTSNILAGLYSLGGNNDVAIIEEMINFAPCFEGYSFEGVPDIRVIVFKGFPIMAMIRLSTSDSDGKANLHQGAVGVGINIRTGDAINAVQFGQRVTHHPDTGFQLNALKVPQWQNLISLAASCYEMSGLGYLGADVVIDKNKGPMLLELNARPGLAIQIATNQGLLPRLKKVEALGQHSMTIKERIAFCQEHFG